jgi:CHAT domain-containing protein
VAKITARELFGIRVIEDLEHVCLTSCESGGLDIQSSSGEAGGLVGACIHMGACSVLSALFPLLDRPTAELLPAIYHRRRDGADVAEALRSEVCERLRAARDQSQSVPFEQSSIDMGIPLTWWGALKPYCSG